MGLRYHAIFVREDEFLTYEHVALERAFEDLMNSGIFPGASPSTKLKKHKKHKHRQVYARGTSLEYPANESQPLEYRQASRRLCHIAISENVAN